MAEENAEADVVRVIKAAGEPSRPMRLLLPNGLLPNSSNHIYITVSDGSDRTYKIACSPKGRKEITLGRGWQRFYHEYKLQPSNILLFKYKGRDDFSVCIFQSSGVERTYVISGGDSSHMTTPQVQRNRLGAPPTPRRQTGCINVPRSAAATEDSGAEPTKVIEADYLAGLSINEMLSLLRRNEKNMDWTVFEAAMVKREEILKDKVDTLRELLSESKAAYLTVSVKLKAKELQVEEAEEAMRGMHALMCDQVSDFANGMQQLEKQGGDLMAKLEDLRHREQLDSEKLDAMRVRVASMVEGNKSRERRRSL